MAEFTFVLDQQSYNKTIKKLEEISKRTRIDLNFIIQDQMRLYLNDIMKMTHPKTLSQGSKRIEGDISKLFTQVRPDFIERLRTEFNKKGTDPIFMPSANGPKKVYKNQLVSNFATHHKSQRDNRGRVRPQRGSSEDYYRGRAMVEGRSLKDYIKKVKAKVGMLKAGWIPAINYFAAKVSGVKAIPNWVQRHARRSGSYNFINSATEMKAVSTNSVPYASKHIDKSLLNIAAKRRQRDIVKNLEKRIEVLTKQFNDSRS
jgi:hypothetical protein